MLRRALVAVLVCCASTFTAAAQVNPPPAEARVVMATPLGPTDLLQLDGRLNEGVWQRALPARDFVQQDPDNGAPATEPTEVRIVYDTHRLVIGVMCFDSEPARILGNQMQRDQSIAADDRFMVSLDTYSDGRSGYYFEINPSGAMGDGLIVPGAALGVTRSWDGIWTARVARTPMGWSAEIEIPFRTLNFDPRLSTWGINFQRTIRRKTEETLWTGSARNQGVTLMSVAGRLVGLSGLSQGIGLDVVPYLAGSTLAAPGRGLHELSRGSYGGDLSYNVTPGLRANLTVNTDFAETEVDQRQVNLTRFPLFFPEKRAFFIEGSSFFDFSRETGTAIVPFFSRRIGLDARGVPEPIAYGVKTTGQVGSFDVGALQVQTRETPSTPGESFTVARSRRRVGSESYVGGILTRRSGAATDDRYTAGADFALASSHFLGKQLIEVSGFWLGTSPAPGTNRGSAYGVRLSYPNDPLTIRMAASNVDAGYDPAVGFVDRRGYRRINPGVRFVRRPMTRLIRRYSVEVDVDMRFDREGRIETRRPDIQFVRMELQSSDLFEFHVQPLYEHLPAPFTIFSGVTLPAGSSYTFLRRIYSLQTANKRVVSWNTRYEDGSFYSGQRRQVTNTLNVRPRVGWLLSVTHDYNDVFLREGRFKTALWRADASTQFSPWLSLVNTMQFDTVTKALGWQLRFRWIQRPGDDWHFVYTHNWIEGDTLMTLDRKAAVKVSRTFRF
jgi:hypothetical protein